MSGNEVNQMNLVGVFHLMGAIFGGEDLGPCDLSRLPETFDKVLHTLDDRERAVLEFRYGIRDGQGRTLETVANKFNVTRERIRQIEAKALRKLRHPTRSRLILSAFLLGWVREIEESLAITKESVLELVRELEKVAVEKGILLDKLHGLGSVEGTLITELNLPVKVVKALQRGGYTYAYELTDEKRISTLRGIGTAALANIRRQLREHSLAKEGG